MSDTAAGSPKPRTSSSAQPPQRVGSRRLPYMPALDGLRGVFVVLGPLLYHARPESVRGGPDILPGGILSLDLFFVLSSFLIVSIALREWDSKSRIDLAAYAGRRVRRLLPALLLALSAVTLYLVLAGDPDLVPRWTGAIVSALTYSANWHEIFVGASYFEQFENPSPLKHVWSFAIEEQFYLFAPLFVIACCKWVRRGRHAVMLTIAVVGAVASAMWMAHLHTPGIDPSRAYFGTDTRAQALFVGIALAALFRIVGSARNVTAGRVVHLMTYPALAVYLWMISNVSHRDHWMFERGGFLLVAAVSAVIIYGMIQPAAWSPAYRFFAWAPIRWTGRISYGLYLYHWPIYLLVTPQRAGSLFGRSSLDGYALLTLHLVLTFAVAAASFHLIERPVIERRWPWPAWRRPVTLAWGVVASLSATALILAGLLLVNSTRPVRVEQVLVPMAAPVTSETGVGSAGESETLGGSPGELVGDSSTDGASTTGSGHTSGESGDGMADNGQRGLGGAANGATSSRATEADESSETPGQSSVEGDLDGTQSGLSGNGTQSTNDGEASQDATGPAATSEDAAGSVSSQSAGSGSNGESTASSGSTDSGESAVLGETGADEGEGAVAEPSPLRVLVVGDSVSAQVATSLRAWAQQNPGEIVVFDDSHLGCTVGRYGLKRLPEGEFGPVGDVCSNWAEPVSFDEVARDDVVSWPTAVEVFAPQVVIAHISPWDVLDRIVPGVIDDWAAISDPVYDDYIRSEYQAASELLTRSGAILYWLRGAELNREPAFDDHAERIDRLNQLVAEGAADLADRRIVFIDYPEFVGEVGSERELAIRHDGVHLSEQGMTEVAPWLVEIVNESS